MEDFKGRTVLVACAARGLGLETARRLAENGARVAVLDLDEAAAVAALGRLPGRGHVGIGADVARPTPGGRPPTPSFFSVASSSSSPM